MAQPGQETDVPGDAVTDLAKPGQIHSLKIGLYLSNTVPSGSNAGPPPSDEPRALNNPGEKELGTEKLL